MIRKIEISSKTIIFTVVLLLAINLFWIVKDLLFSLFIAFIIMSALKPFVNFLARKNIPRVIAAFIIYAVFIGIIINLLVIIFPPLIKESTLLLKTLPTLLQSLLPNPVYNIELLTQYIPNITNQVFDIAKIVFSNAVFVISTLFFGFYFIVEENMLEQVLVKFFDKEKTDLIKNIVIKIEKRMNAWFWGEIILMTIVGLMTFIGLNLIGIKYSLALSVLAGLLEAVPNLGPTISAVPAVILGLSQSYFLGFAAVALSFIIQQLENNLIVPMVMRKAVGLNPIITLIALIIGGKLAGILGVLLAIPLTLFIETIIVEVINSQKTSVNMR